MVLDKPTKIEIDRPTRVRIRRVIIEYDDFLMNVHEFNEYNWDDQTLNVLKEIMR